MNGDRAGTFLQSTTREMVCKGAQGGASLVLAFNGNSQRQREVLIVGGGKLAALRTVACLEADFNVTLAYDVSVEPEPELQQRLSTGEITFAPVSKDEHLVSWMEQRLPSLAFVIIADTLSTQCQRSKTSCSQLSEACRARRIPINIADQPQLSDFTFPTTHRFTLPDDPDKKSSLQLSVTTSSSACRLATRIKRQAVAALPLEVGLAADKICQARKALKHVSDDSLNGEEENQLSNINRPVAQRSRSSADASFPKLDTQARLRFVAQMSEYWPMSRLAALTPDDLESVLELQQNKCEGDVQQNPAASTSRPMPTSRHSLDVGPLQPPAARKGQIILIGAGTGSPALLTRAAHAFLTSQATLILSDKLVPAEVLALVPPYIPLHIARKFPGNAEGAQSELISQAIQGAQRGEVVVRLKQGDVYLYGRGGEEVIAFREAGFEPIVLPGLSSVLAGPTMAGIPVTQRGVAESMTVCTGVGRGGKGVRLPPYERARTLVVLMGVARLASVIETLTNVQNSEGRTGSAYPPHTPIAIIERASSPDQRVIASTLEHIVSALEQVGEQRPPAMMVIGWAVMALDGKGDMTVLDEAQEYNLDELDRRRIQRWLGAKSHLVKEGLPSTWQASIEGIVH